MEHHHFATVPLDLDTMRVVDVAELLGVSYERVRQIAAADPSFPSPVETERPRRWDPAEVEAWAEAHWWGKRPWRERPAEP